MLTTIASLVGLMTGAPAAEVVSLEKLVRAKIVVLSDVWLV